MNLQEGKNADDTSMGSGNEMEEGESQLLISKKLKIIVESEMRYY